MKFSPFHYVWLIMLSCSMGCISEIDLEFEGAPKLIISGVISNSVGERQIRIRQSRGLDSLSTPVNASGMVFENGEFWTDLQAPVPGILELPLSHQLNAGNHYEVEIQLPDGRKFRSFPQVVQPLKKPDSLDFTISTFQERQDDGTLSFEWVVEIFAYVDISEAELGNTFLRWQIDNAWAFRDWRDTVCYLTEGTKEFDPVILSGRGLTPGLQRVKVARRPLGDAFLETIYFNTYIHRIDSTAFTYYENAFSLVSNEGTLFDEIPAQVQGNIHELTNEEAGEPIIGFIEFSLADTSRLRINRGDFTFILNDPCDGWTCNPFDTVCLCEDCGDWFWAKEGIETETPPPYWE